MSIDASDALEQAQAQLSEQSSLLAEAAQRVEELIDAQQRLQVAVRSEVQQRKALAARCKELESAPGRGWLFQATPSDAKVAALRKQLGGAVKDGAAQQNALASARTELAKERDHTVAARQQLARSEAAQDELSVKLDELRAQHAALQERHATSEAEAERRSTDLQSKIDEMEAAEKHRLEIQAAMEAAEALAAPPPAPASIMVSQAPPPAPAPDANFAAAAGGFSL